jgi:selT/selW/selH-like putative selenoprotein
MILLALVIAGENICKVIGIDTPALVKKLQESPWIYGFLIFMVGNNVQNSLMTTGAFEIYVDGQLVHSKLESGKMPNVEILSQQLLEYGIELSAQPVRRR